MQSQMCFTVIYS